MIEVLRLVRASITSTLNKVVGSLMVCIMVRSLDIVVKGVCGLDKIAAKYLFRIICMVVIWVIAFEF